MSMEDIKTGGGMTLTDIEIDAIGEIMNISMGSAATAVSELLGAKVWITTPQVKVLKVADMEYQQLEPAVCVKIQYLRGVLGSNIMVLKQDDVQMILNQLMGRPLVVEKDFVFDELNISAVSEVMNQMMGASATALSDFLGIAIDISTPAAYLMDDHESISTKTGLDENENVAAINFKLTIDTVIESEFISIMNLDLAKEVAGRMLNDINESNAAEQVPAPQAAPVQQAAPIPPPAPATPPAPPAQPIASTPPPQAAPVQQAPPPPPPAYMSPEQAVPQQQMPPYAPPTGAYPPGYPSPPYGYAPPQGAYPPYGYAPPPQPATPVHQAQLYPFETFDSPALSGEQRDNLQLLMGVPLEVTVEIGSAHKRVKDILEFTQGTIVELERQAGAPVDIIVNGHLIARGDVVVIDDNFAVRITDIVKSRFLESLADKG